MKTESFKKSLYTSKYKHEIPEITLKAVVISIILAVILAASNAYLALKIGTTISASIPASILSIAILKFFKKSNVLESNIIQTAASAGEGVAAAVSFILPAMVILRIWRQFPFFETSIIILLGGLLGVLFSIPLRKVMLNIPSLTFPEGTAIGRVLCISNDKSNNQFNLISYGAFLGGIVSLLQTGFKILSDNLQLWFAVSKKIVFGFSFGFSPASLAAGYIIGIDVSTSILFGLIVGWMFLLPIFSLYYKSYFMYNLSPYDIVHNIWSNHLRFVGVGTMLVGGIWTFCSLLKPVFLGLVKSLKDFYSIHNKPIINRTEHDIPINIVFIGSISIIFLIFIVFFHFMKNMFFIKHLFFFLFFLILGMVCLGFLVSVICGYFTGLIGSTNNPLSGIMIMVTIIFSFSFLFYFSIYDIKFYIKDISSIVIILTLTVATIGSITNENLQDLKAGNMVGATPWKQQIMLAVGVAVSSLIVSPILNLLLNAYGIGGVYPHLHMNKNNMLSAPQASLISAVTNGVLRGNLEWSMIIIGSVIAIFIIILDYIFKKKFNRNLPALAFGLGIYLPPEVIIPIVIGGFISWLVKNKNKHLTKNNSDIYYQRSILFSCGMVAGSAVMGVLMAIPFVILGDSNALSLVNNNFQFFANCLGMLVFIILGIILYFIGTRDNMFVYKK